MPNSWIVGARSDCDLVVDVASVSGRHCRLSRDEAGFFLEDLKSTNGTFVNGVRLPPNGRAPLKPDDAVHLGSHALDVRGLLAKLDSGPAGSLEFHGRELVLGRSPTCDRSIDQPMVSSRHARLFRSADQILIEDLSSANGTFVNGRRIDRPTVVNPGDTIGLGSYTFKLGFSIPPPSPVPPAPVPDQGQEKAQASDAGFRPILAMLAQAPLAALMMVAVSRSSVPAGLFGLVMAAVWFGLSCGIQADLIDDLIGRLGVTGGRGARVIARFITLAAFVLALCLLAWFIVSNAAGLRAASLPSLSFLSLAGWIGLVLGLLIASLVSNRHQAWGGILALLVAFCLLGGWRPTLAAIPDAVSPLMRPHARTVGVRGAAPPGDRRDGGSEPGKWRRPGCSRRPCRGLFPGIGQADGSDGRWAGPRADVARLGRTAGIRLDERAAHRLVWPEPGGDGVIHLALAAGSGSRSSAFSSRLRAEGWAR